MHQRKAVVEINPEQPNVLNSKEVLRIRTVDVGSYRERQCKVLYGRALADRVIRSLQLWKNTEFYRSRVLFGLIGSNPDKMPSASDPGPPDKTS